MPVIRCALDDDVNIVPLHDLAEVGVFVGCLAVLGEFLRGRVEMFLVHIADGKNVAITAGVQGIVGALTAATNQCDAGTVVRAGQAGHVGHCIRREGCISLDDP